MLKTSGVNFVRTAHYPQDQRFLELCDEYGLLVWEESIGWQNGEKDFRNEKFLEYCGGEFFYEVSSDI